MPDCSASNEHKKSLKEGVLNVYWNIHLFVFEKKIEVSNMEKELCSIFDGTFGYNNFMTDSLKHTLVSQK